MRLQIKATGFVLTPSLRSFVEEKFNSLEKFVEKWDENNAVILRLEVSKNTKHHKKGKVFYAEVNIDLPKHLVRLEEVDTEMHEAVDKLKDRLKNELQKLRGKLADH